MDQAFSLRVLVVVLCLAVLQASSAPLLQSSKTITVSQTESQSMPEPHRIQKRGLVPALSIHPAPRPLFPYAPFAPYYPVPSLRPLYPPFFGFPFRFPFYPLGFAPPSISPPDLSILPPFPVTAGFFK